MEQLVKFSKNKKKYALQIPDLLLERTSLKDQFIAKKQAARANITLLKGGLDVLKDRELRELQEEYREVDSEFKALGLLSEKESLFDGAEKRRAGKGGDGFDPSRAKNDDLLDKAASTQKASLDKLKEGLKTVEATKEQAKFTAAQLEQDREKLKRIDSGLDEVQGELELSRILITRVVKSLATDKIIIAFAFLLVAGIVGIVCYATLYKGQTVRAAAAPRRAPQRNAPRARTRRQPLKPYPATLAAQHAHARRRRRRGC